VTSHSPWGCLTLALWLSGCGGASGGEGRGFGAQTAGGSGTEVVHVTSLADSGEGTLRAAVSKSNRRVVFDVAGTIRLEQHLSVRQSFVTIDGSSAPSPGITLENHGLFLEGSESHDVVIRGIRVRNPRADGITVKEGARSIWIDHVSLDGCGDGNVDVTQRAEDVTVSWSLLTGCAKNMLIKYGARRVSVHHNAFVRSQYRNPFVSNDDAGTLAGDVTADVRNNLVWGWGTGGGGSGIECGAKANFVANYYSSPQTRADSQARAIIGPGCTRGHPGLLFAMGNVSADGIDPNATTNQPEPFAAPTTESGPACETAREVLAQAGAHPRDAVDQSRLAGISIACP
jgi:pectate lyase